MDIRREVSYLKRYYKTNDPFEVIKSKNILLMYENLGCIRGYYNLILRQKQIHLNCNLDEFQKKFTGAHELGHAIMHPKSCTPFLLENTYQSVDKLEIQANKFAVELLIEDQDLLEAQEQGYTVDQISCLLGYQKELIELRLK